MTMNPDHRAVSPIVGTLFVVAIVVILAATISVTVLDTTEEINEPAPNVVETTGEFEPGGGADEQLVRVTHIAGESVDVGDIEIILQANGPDEDLPTDARLVNLPADGSDIDDDNIQGDDDLIDTRNLPPDGSSGNQIITSEDSNLWDSGDTIQFRIAVSGADFRDSPASNNPEADELEVTIVHIPSDAIIFEDTFTT